MNVCKYCLITGQVQGVFYRQKTLEKAKFLNIKGWVRNRENGDVECLLCGEEELVLELCRWLSHGPPAAKVKKVTIQECPWEEHSEFVIKETRD